MVNEAGYPTMRQLLSAYFHQDWSDEYGGSWEGAVEDFARREPSRVEAAAIEITTLMQTRSDVDLTETLGTLGSFYWPGDDPCAYRAWLEGLRRQVEVHVTKQSAASPPPATGREA